MLSASMAPSILVTGGAGYIGSHVAADLLTQAPFDCKVVILDNLRGASADVLDRLEKLSGVRPFFEQLSLLDGQALDKVFEKHAPVVGVIHLAAYKSIGESTSDPLSYYINNVQGTTQLLSAMRKASCRNMIFSSSATVYGVPESLPLTETSTVKAINTYGRTKVHCEQILRDLHTSEPDFWNITMLRYFNPSGAHQSGLIGESLDSKPSNLMPIIGEVLLGRRETIHVFGDDWPTADGTGVRDFVHVVDLARAHSLALDAMLKDCTAKKTNELKVYNVGTGKGYSVMSIIDMMEKVTNRQIPKTVSPRRYGDCGEVYASAELIGKELNWAPQYGLEEMCDDTWRWLKNRYRADLEPSKKLSEHENRDSAVDLAEVEAL